MENGYVVWVISSLVIGLVTSAVAKHKGKDPFVWFWIGVVANVLILLVWRIARQRQKEGVPHGK